MVHAGVARRHVGRGGGDGVSGTAGLQITGVHKRFGAIHANDDVSLEIRRGSIHGLVGENGAGKSTLAKILSGYHPADAGTVELDGVALQLRSPADALAAGVGLLHQDPLVLGAHTVLENFQLGSGARRQGKHGSGARRQGKHGSNQPRWLRPRQAAAALAEQCAALGFRLDPRRLVRTLGVGERQQLEIVRLLSLGVKVLILDEPTTSISGPQRDRLFDALRRVASGGLSVLYVTHKLEEVDDLCDHVTVLRAGRVTDDAPVPIERRRLVRSMFGTIPELGSRTPIAPSTSALVVSGLTGADGGVTTSPVTLTAGAGEVIGLAGVEGSGQRGFLRMLAGVTSASGGRATLGGTDLTHHGLARRRRLGIEYLPADRMHDGLVPGLALDDHFAVAGALPRRAGWRRLFVDRAAAWSAASGAIDRLNIKATPASIPEQLSGGNQQRALLSLAPELLRLLLMEHPTRGLDLSSAEWVWSQLSDRRQHGTVIVYSSSDLDELRRWSDRILVFFAGSVIAELSAAEADAERLGLLIGGVREPA